MQNTFFQLYFKFTVKLTIKMAGRSPTPAQRREAEGLDIGGSDVPDESAESHEAEDEPQPSPAAFQPRDTKNRIPNIKIPFFRGGNSIDPGEYKEWRRELSAIKIAYKIDERDFAGLVFLATKGDARDVLWSINPTDFETNAQCLSDMMKMLDREYDRPEWEKADHAAEQFEKCRRAPGEKMIAYLRNIHRAYVRMLKEDKGTMISDNSMARRILRRSGLSADEQRQVLASCNHMYDLEKIKDALRLTYGDAHKDDRKRPFATRNNFPNSQMKKSHGGKPGWRPRRPHGTHATDIIEEEYEHDQDEADEEDGDDHEEDGDEEDQDEEEDDEHDPEQNDEEDDDDEDDDLQELFGAFVQFMRAGKKMRSKSKGWKKPKGKGKGKGSTSSTPAGTNAAGKKTGKCLDCGKYGHWKGDPECEHVKSGKTKPFKPHGAHVVTEYHRLDADDDADDADLHEAIVNSLQERSGASQEEETCVISSLTAAGSRDVGGSQHERFDAATAATATTSESTEPPAYHSKWRSAHHSLNKTKREREPSDDGKDLNKMTKESVRDRRTRPPAPPIPIIKKEPHVPKAKIMRLHIRGEHDPPLEDSDSDTNPWANLAPWTPPPDPSLPKAPTRIPWKPPPSAAEINYLASLRPPPMQKAPPTRIPWSPPPKAVPTPPTKAPPSSRPESLKHNDERDIPPPPPGGPGPNQTVPPPPPGYPGYKPPKNAQEQSPPAEPKKAWVQEAVWDPWEDAYVMHWRQVPEYTIIKEDTSETPKPQDDKTRSIERTTPLPQRSRSRWTTSWRRNVARRRRS